MIFESGLAAFELFFIIFYQEYHNTSSLHNNYIIG